MPTDVVMPQMGESIFEGTITKWLKKTGDAVQKDEPLFEISTDKVDAEIPSPVSGVLAEIKTPEGTTVEVNTVVGVIAEGSAGQKSVEPASLSPGVQPAAKFAAAEREKVLPAAAASDSASSSSRTEVVMPQMG